MYTKYRNSAGTDEKVTNSVQTNSAWQRIAVQVSWCGNLYLVDELQTDRFLNPEFEITIVHTNLHY